MKVESGSIYLIPPAKNVTRHTNQLRLTDKPTGQILNLPINIFFESLGHERKQYSVGSVLSGTAQRRPQPQICVSPIGVHPKKMLAQFSALRYPNVRRRCIMAQINTIMLVDDNKADNFFHKMIIQKGGFSGEILEFQYAEHALTFLEANTKTVDLILLDVNMPRMDGFEFLEAYENLESTSKAQAIVIMLTTSLNPADEEKAMTYSDLKGFFHKPLTKDQVALLMKTFPNLPPNS